MSSDTEEQSEKVPLEKVSQGLFPAGYRRSIILFLIATFFYWLGLYLFVPIFPVYAQSMGASLSMVGVIVASYAFPQLLLRIPMGIYYDSMKRRKPMVAMAMVAVSTGALALGLAPNVSFLLLGRIITGIGGATWVAFTVYMASYYPRQSGARAIGLINSVNAIALVVATFSGGVIAEYWSPRHTFFIAALLGMVGLVVLLISREPAAQPASNISFASIRKVISSRLLLIVSFMGVLLQFAMFAGMFGFIPIYAASIGASSADLGMITTVALAAAAVAAMLSIPVAERIGYTVTIIIGAVLIAAALVIVPLIHTIPVLIAIQVLNGFGRGVLQTVLMALSIHSIAPQQRATAMGFYQAVYAVGMIAGPMVSGVLADNMGLSSVFYLSASLLLVIGGIAFLPSIRKS
jgi:predicted MFS family arabinose efflux permease